MGIGGEGDRVMGGNALSWCGKNRRNRRSPLYLDGYIGTGLYPVVGSRCKSLTQPVQHIPLYAIYITQSRYRTRTEPYERTSHTVYTMRTKYYTLLPNADFEHVQSYVNSFNSLKSDDRRLIFILMMKTNSVRMTWFCFTTVYGIAVSFNACKYMLRTCCAI